MKLLREIELRLAGGSDVQSACRSVGVSDATYYKWRKKYGGMEVLEAKQLKALEDENLLLTPPVRTVGVMGDACSYDYACALRAVTSTDGMTADSYPFAHEFLTERYSQYTFPTLRKRRHQQKHR